MLEFHNQTCISICICILYLHYVFVSCICIMYLYFVFVLCICILYLYLCLSDHLPFPSLSKWRKPSTKSSTVSVIFLPDTACHQKSCNFCHTLDFIKKSCHFLHWIFCLHWISSKSCQTLPSLWAAGWYHFHYRLNMNMYVVLCILCNEVIVSKQLNRIVFLKSVSCDKCEPGGEGGRSQMWREHPGLLCC